jgi:hypothetical protein
VGIYNQSVGRFAGDARLVPGQLNGAGKRFVKAVGQERLISVAAGRVTVPRVVNVSVQTEACLNDVGIEVKPKKVRQLLPKHLPARFQ